MSRPSNICRTVAEPYIPLSSHAKFIPLPSTYFPKQFYKSGLSNLWQMAGRNYFFLKLAGQYTNYILLDKTSAEFVANRYVDSHLGLNSIPIFIGVNLDKKWRGPDHGECRTRASNGSLGAEPPAGSSGRAPGQGIRGGTLVWGSDIQRKGHDKQTVTLSKQEMWGNVTLLNIGLC